MIVTDLNGNTEILANFKNVAIDRKLNGVYSLGFTIIKNEINQHSYNMIQEESIIEENGQEFRVKQVNEVSLGKGAKKEVKAKHRMFDLIDEFQYDYLAKGEYTLSEILTHIFNGSNFTYTLSGSYDNVYFEEFGGDNRLALLKKALNKFGAEVDPDNTHLNIKVQTGLVLDEQFRYGYNVNVIRSNTNTDNLVTVLKGYCNKDDYGVYLTEATYRSPMADIYGDRHGDIVFADDLVTEAQLIERLKEVINDKPEVNYVIEHTELQKQDFNSNLEVGDQVLTIWEPLNIELDTRIIGYKKYPYSPHLNRYEFGEFKNLSTDQMAEFKATKKKLDKVVNDNGKVRFDAMVEQVQRSSEAILNSQTELEYPKNGGILARSKTNSNHIVLFNSSGIGISKDNGVNFTEAITVNGFNLSAGVIGQLTADNIDATDLHVDAANVDGTLTANQIDATNLEVQAANILGKLVASQIDTTGLKAEELDVTKGSTSYIQVDILPNPTGTDYIPVMTIRDGDMTYLFQDGQVFNIQSDYDIDLLAKNGRVNVKSALYATGNIQTDGTIYIGGTEVATKNDTLTAVFG